MDKQTEIPNYLQSPDELIRKEAKAASDHELFRYASIIREHQYQRLIEVRSDLEQQINNITLTLQSANKRLLILDDAIEKIISIDKTEKELISSV